MNLLYKDSPFLFALMTVSLILPKMQHEFFLNAVGGLYAVFLPDEGNVIVMYFFN